MKKNRQGIAEEDVEMTPADEDEDKDMDDGKSDRSDVSLSCSCFQDMADS